MEKAKDLLTGEEFTRKKKSQKYSCREHRIKANNDRANKLRSETSEIDAILHTNRRILKKLLADKKEITVPKPFLEGKGFTFPFHTHYETYENVARLAIYNFIIIQIDKDFFKIIKYD